MCSVSTPNLKSTLFVIVCETFLALWNLNVAITVTYYVDFRPKFHP